MLIALTGLVLLPALPAQAQQTNLSAFQDMALQCLASAPDTVRSFRLDAPAQMPYLRTSLVERWRADSRVIFLADSSLMQQPLLPLLTYEIEEAQVVYTREKRKRLRRTVALEVRYALTSAEGQIWDEQHCRRVFTDTIRSADVAGLESESFPETRAALPEAGWIRRYLEPAVLTAAAGIGIYLFFSLRSSQSESSR